MKKSLIMVAVLAMASATAWAGEACCKVSDKAAAGTNACCKAGVTNKCPVVCKSEAPKVEAPKVEAPKVAAPKVAAPKVETK
jgi:hypothetical protein